MEYALFLVICWLAGAGLAAIVIEVYSWIRYRLYVRRITKLYQGVDLLDD